MSEIEQNEGEARSYHRWQFRLGALGILLFDTLVSRLEPEEVESVLAHELGHHVTGDVWRGRAVQGAVTLAAIWVADRALASGAGAIGLSGPADIAGLLLLGFVTKSVSLIALSVTNAWSRRVETRADDFALRLSQDPAAFIAAMERLAGLNLAERLRWPSNLRWAQADNPSSLVAPDLLPWIA